MELANGNVGSDRFLQQTPPRILKSHLPLQFFHEQFQRYPDLKVIQTVRNPKDTIVSMFNHFSAMPQLGAFKGTWDQFFEIVIEGKGPFGDIFKFYADWHNFNKDRENSLVLKYEDIKKDHRGHVIKIAKFMGFNLSDPVIDTIVEMSSKEAMAKAMKPVMADLRGKEQPGSAPSSSPYQFVRKATVGDWTNYFSQEQSDLVDAKCKEHLHRIGLTFEYSA